MFHLISTTHAENPSEGLRELSFMVEALRIAFDTPDMEMTPEGRMGFGLIAQAIGDSMQDLANVIPDADRAGKAAPSFDFSSPAVPDLDLPEVIPAEGFAPPSFPHGVAVSAAVPRELQDMELLLHGYFIGHAVAERDAPTWSDKRPRPRSPQDAFDALNSGSALDGLARARARAVMERMEEAGEGLRAVVASRELSGEEVDELWITHLRAVVRGIAMPDLTEPVPGEAAGEVAARLHDAGDDPRRDLRAQARREVIAKADRLRAERGGTASA